MIHNPNSFNMSFVAEWSNPTIKALSSVSNYHANSYIGPYRSNGTRSDCYPNNPVTPSTSCVRHDAPYDLVSQINWNGKIEHAKDPSKQDKQFQPFIGFMNDFEKITQKYPTHSKGFYLS